MAARAPRDTDRPVGRAARGIAGEEKRTSSMEGDNLVVDTSAAARNGGAPNITKVTYKKYERGYGG